MIKMSSHTSTPSNTSLPSAAPPRFRPIPEIEAALAVKKEHLRRALVLFAARFQDGQEPGRRRRRRGIAARQIEGFMRQKKALETELWRAKAMQWWIEDQWKRLEAADRYVAIALHSTGFGSEIGTR